MTFSFLHFYLEQNIFTSYCSFNDSRGKLPLLYPNEFLSTFPALLMATGVQLHPLLSRIAQRKYEIRLFGGSKCHMNIIFVCYVYASKIEKFSLNTFWFFIVSYTSIGDLFASCSQVNFLFSNQVHCLYTYAMF